MSCFSIQVKPSGPPVCVIDDYDYDLSAPMEQGE